MPARTPEKRAPDPKPRGGHRRNGGRKPLEGKWKQSLRLETSFLAEIGAATKARGIGRQQFLREALAELLDLVEAHPPVRVEPVLFWRNPVMFTVILQEADVARAQALVAAGRAESLTDVLREAGLRAARKVKS